MPERGAGNYSTTLGENGRWAGTPFRCALFNLADPGLRCACHGLHAVTPSGGGFYPVFFFFLRVFFASFAIFAFISFLPAV